MRDVSFLNELPIAHRGYYNDENPENSIMAFARAVEANFAIELDLQLSKDDVVMVFHDDSLDRMCGVRGGIKDYTYEELQKFNLGKTKYKIPTFKEVLEIVDGKVPMVVELKTIKEKNALLPIKMYELLKEYKGKYVVQSFDPKLMKAVRLAYPNILRGQLVYDMHDAKQNAMVRFLVAHLYTNVLSKPDYINSDFNHKPLMLRIFKKRGGEVICYTARTIEEYNEAFKFFDNVIFEKFEPVSFKEKKHI